jgi:filamentous hemagglutinin
MIWQNESGDSSATTRSAVSAGTINVTNPTAQTQDVATLSRDTTNTNGTVSATPDVNAILNQQADTMQAAQAAGQVVAQGIGTYADMKRDEAIENAQTAEKRGDKAAAQGYWNEAQSWADDGSNRIALHLAGGGLIGGLGGGGIGNAVGGAAGAGLTSYLAGRSRAIAESVGGETGSEIVGKLTANVLATLGGGLVGGAAGAATASNVNLYNQWNDRSSAYADEQIAQAMGESGNKRPSLLELVLRGIANGLNAVVGMGGGMPPAAGPGAVAVSGVTQALAGGMGSSASVAGYGAGNATLSDSGNERPSPRQSENDVGSDLGPGHDPQMSYKDGKQVPYGTSGSVRPDFVAADGTASFEVKNYNIATNSSGLIDNVAKQAVQRAANLPDGMQQQIVIDTRGQVVTDAQKTSIIQGIVQKSNGIISPTAIRFK